MTQNDPSVEIAELSPAAFELPKWLVEPAVRSCRLFNTAFDFIFYDVQTLRTALADRDAPMQARGEKRPSRIVDFNALSDPEGSLLLIPSGGEADPPCRQVDIELRSAPSGLRNLGRTDATGDRAASVRLRAR